MPNLKSQIKRVKTNERDRKSNKSVRSRIKTAVKATREAIDKKNAELAKTELKTTIRILDTGVSHGVLHRNTAGRTKSRLTRRVQSLQG